MSFDPAWVLISLFLSSVGFVAFMYGKRRSRFVHLTLGLVLMIFPYFVTNLVALSVFGGALLLALWLSGRLQL